jgi:hypothetical protein
MYWVCGVGSLVIRFDLCLLVGNELVVALGGQIECAGDDAERDEEEYGPRGGEEVEAGVEVPGGGEAGGVVEEVGLEISVNTTCAEMKANLLVRKDDRRTTIAIPAHCTTAPNNSTPAATCHPATLRCTPPAIMTMNETSVHSSTTTEKEIRKPTVRHMLQKDGSFAQSLACGKGSQVFVMAEQRLWSPYEYCRLPLCFYRQYMNRDAVGVRHRTELYETHRGSAILAIVIKVPKLVSLCIPSNDNPSASYRQ